MESASFDHYLFGFHLPGTWKLTFAGFQKKSPVFHALIKNKCKYYIFK